MVNTIKIAIILPRFMNFSYKNATAIDMCAYDFVRFSKYRDTTTFFVREIENPYEGVNIEFVRDNNHSLNIADLSDKLKDYSPDIIHIHQHRKYATLLAKNFPNSKIILHKHNYAKYSQLRYYFHLREYKRFHKSFWVSDVSRDDYLRHYKIAPSTAVTIHNGLELEKWHPQKDRKKQILFAGRLAAEKGVLEAALAVSDVLKENNGWNGLFILSLHKHKAEYREEFEKIINEHNYICENKIITEFDKPHQFVKSAFENAAISLVPSNYDEPFGRVALEAMAGGSALISSTKGGLKEVIKEGAIGLNVISRQTISEALSELIIDEKKREMLAENGHKTANRYFNIKNLSAKIDNIYNELVNQ